MGFFFGKNWSEKCRSKKLLVTELLSQLRQAAKSFQSGVVVASFMGALLTTSGAQAEKVGYPEKEELKFGFIKLTDMAPLAIAYEKGFFEEEGLYVTLEAQANWKSVVG